jgi:tRNA G18 (ribose-2'-O)-methylase SpoU
MIASKRSPPWVVDPGRRRRGDPMLLEGWSLLEEAWRSGVEVAEVFVLDEPAPRERLRDLLERFSRSSRPRVFAVASAILKKVATTSEPQAVAASAIVPQRSPEPRRDGSPALLCGLWNIADPGNLGATLRVAEAAGADALLSFGKGVDPWSPKVLRASAGSALRLPVGGASRSRFRLGPPAMGSASLRFGGAIRPALVGSGLRLRPDAAALRERVAWLARIGPEGR